MTIDKFLHKIDDDTPHPNTPSLMPLAAPRDSTIVTCTECGKTFIPKRYWQHFCSAACRVAHNARAPSWKPKLDDLT